ncbi:CDP-diacylglycerol--serine O-phosphatidyltransferase, partial [Heyndrickxia sporothermodurans]
ITESNGFFTGLPITAAGCLATLSYLALPILPSHLYLFIILILALFMIASFRLKKF